MSEIGRSAGTTDDHPLPEMLVLRLYVTRGATNSVRALANLKAILEEHFPGRYSLDVVDLLENPTRAFEDDILVTPTLVKLGPPPCTRMMGNLSHTGLVIEALAGRQGA